MKIFFKISFRNLWHNRFYSAINFVGLSIGITCMLLALLYWKDEHHYDEFHANNPNIYRILTHTITKDGKTEILAGTGQVQGPAFKAGVPDVQSYCRVMGGDIYSDITANRKTLQLQPLFVDDSFLSVFTFPLISGSPYKILNDPGNVVITESVSKRFFNTTEVIGKTLTIDADPSFQRLGKPLVVSGVVKDPPANSSLQFDLLLPFSFMRLSFEDNNWLNAYLGTFIVLQPNADKNVVLEKFNNIYKLNAAKQIGDKKIDGGVYDPEITYSLESFTDIHLSSLTRVDSGNAESGIVNQNNPLYANAFLGISIFILLMAVVNFININIAASLKRSKEVGIRKIAGSNKYQIILLFFIDAFIICLLAMLFSILLLKFIIPLFNDLAGKQIVFEKMFDIRLIVYFSFAFIIITLLAGIYPAWVLSNFKPREVLYNKQRLSGRDLFGNALVVFQFSLATFLLISVMVYYNQMNFIQTKDLGYNPHNIIRTQFGGNRDYKKVHDVLVNEFSKEPSIESVSFGNNGWQEEIEVNNRHFKAVYRNIDKHFLPLAEIPIVNGRNLSADFKMDVREGILVNEAFVQAASIVDPVGKKISVGEVQPEQKIIQGVVKNFHFGSLRDKISPLVMYAKEIPGGDMWVKFEKSKQQEAMAAIERIYKRAIPGAVYKYSFLDELNAKQYFQELRWQKIVTIATILSFIVCCLGLLGLAHLSTNYRIKEIGVRKVLGATVTQIIAILSLNFLKLVMIAFAIAAPLALLVMNNWLEDFAYRIGIDWWILVLAAGIVAGTALASVIIQAIKVALANPVKALRSE